MWKHRRIAAALVACFTLGGCQKDEIYAPAVRDDSEVYAGGATTVFGEGSSSFSMPAANLSATTLEQHLEGDRQFEMIFVTAPAPVNGGLGPLFNNTSCAGCHPADGRGKPPSPGEGLSSMLIRISGSGSDEHGGPGAVPLFGTQLQDKAVFGKVPEASVEIQWVETPGVYGDGTSFSLRRPSILISGRIGSLQHVSARVAPPVFGLGLLEAVDDATLQDLANNPDALRDGVSGRPNSVWDAQAGRRRTGRFGWKAGNPSLLQQSAGAYNEDMGVTTPYFPIENCSGTAQCDTLPDDPEVPQGILDAVTLYTQTLGVPARRNFDDPGVLRGKSLFRSVGCMSCHVERLTTGVHPTVPEVSRQTIFPYTDLLLHDMGPGLGDGRPEFDATGTEWRTPPLWGIGLTRIVSGHTFFLHDGRARNLEEAILWHGGEAESAKERFRKLSREDRAIVILFLQSL
jgi:CxxC motif-containing protein (DUF1111 family)